MPTSTSEPSDRLVSRLREEARAQGLGHCRIGPAQLPPTAGARLSQYVAAGRHGTMQWMADRLPQRRDPRLLWPEARSAILLALPYGQGFEPMDRLQHKSAANISVYALNRDYHDVFKRKLKLLAKWFADESGAAVKVFVDTAPLMEKPLAQQAGLGWQGKHTNLVSRQLGSWFFIGVILTNLKLAPDGPEDDHCGTCHACFDICPTQAFPAPYQLDARRCISYLTIEHKGHIPVEFRKPMGNRVFGCDDCLAVCPWNKFAQAAAEQKLLARADLLSPPLSRFLLFDEQSFRRHFSGSPVKRTGRNRFIRNCLIACGNSGDASLSGPVRACLSDQSPLVRAMAVWALRQLDAPTFQQQRQSLLADETDAQVRAEWCSDA